MFKRTTICPAHAALTRFRPSRGAATLLLLGWSCACTPRVLPAGHTLQAPSEVAHATSALPSASEAPAATIDSKPPPTEAPLYAEIPEEGTLIGGPGGIALEALSRTGHWVAYCRAAEEGRDVFTDARGAARSDVRLFLQIGQEREPIDDLLAFDADGRFLVFEKDGVPFLLDAVENQRLDLGLLEPDLRRDALPDHRSFAFSDSGLLVLTRSGHALLVPLPNEGVSDTLEPSMARPVAVGPRPVWRIAAEGPHLLAYTMPSGSTTHSWPVKESKAIVHRCGSPHHPYQAFSKVSAYYPFPDLEVSWKHLDEKLSARIQPAPIQLEPAPGFVMPFRSGWVRRQGSGRLLFVDGTSQKQIASERCGARILHADESTGLFLISCEHYTPIAQRPSQKKKRKPEYRFDLYLVHPGYVRNLHADVARTGIDVKGEQASRFVALRPGAAAALVDFTSKKLFQLDEGSFVLSVGRKGALVRRDHQLLYWTVSSQIPLPQKMSSLTPVLQAPRVVVLDKTMYRLEETLHTDELSHPPLFVTALGYSLIPKEAGTLERWPRGPLLLLPPPAMTPPKSGDFSNGQAVVQAPQMRSARMSRSKPSLPMIRQVR